MPNTERIRPEDFREVTGGDPGSPGRGSRIFKRVALYGGAAGLAFWSVLEAGLHASPHDDLWWYLAAGRHMTRYREIVKVDPFTHTVTGQHWVKPRVAH